MPLYTFRQICLPYGLHDLGNDRWCAFNREYRPLSFGEGGGHFDQSDYPTALPLRITPKLAAKLDWRGAPERGRIMLYNDACLPDRSREHWLAYQEKLYLLCAESTEPSGKPMSDYLRDKGLYRPAS